MMDAYSLEQQLWYCVRSKVKQERLAEQCLQRHAGVEAFAPRIRFRRRTRRGSVWFVDALFPGYLFARFSMQRQARRVLSTIGVTGLVHFGDQTPALPTSVIGELRDAMGEEGVALIEDAIKPGDEIKVSAGPFMGLSGLVRQYLPPAHRVRVLLDFMGREMEVEMDEAIVTLAEPRYVGSILTGAS